jgi:hypothetical protein
MGSKNHLPDNFYKFGKARTTMTSKQLNETLLATDNRFFACGDLYKLVSKKIGPNVYEVTKTPVTQEDLDL